MHTENDNNRARRIGPVTMQHFDSLSLDTRSIGCSPLFLNEDMSLASPYPTLIAKGNLLKSITTAARHSRQGSCICGRQMRVLLLQ